MTRWWAIMLFSAVFLWGVAPAMAAEADAVDRAILTLLQRGARAFRIQPTPRHPMARSAEQRRTLAEAISAAAAAHAVPAMLLLAIAYREGSFRHAALGKLQERTTFQVMPRVARVLRTGRLTGTPVPTCTQADARGAAMCAAALLRYGFDRCGTWGNALILYATGHRCTPGTSAHLRFIQRDRLGLQQHLTTLGTEDGSP